jgi:hypothetical protein
MHPGDPMARVPPTGHGLRPRETSASPPSRYLRTAALKLEQRQLQARTVLIR